MSTSNNRQVVKKPSTLKSKPKHSNTWKTLLLLAYGLYVSPIVSSIRSFMSSGRKMTSNRPRLRSLIGRKNWTWPMRKLKRTLHWLERRQLRIDFRQSGFLFFWLKITRVRADLENMQNLAESA